jgi:hypothetical protein
MTIRGSNSRSKKAMAWLVGGMVAASGLTTAVTAQQYQAPRGSVYQPQPSSNGPQLLPIPQGQFPQSQYPQVQQPIRTAPTAPATAPGGYYNAQAPQGYPQPARVATPQPMYTAAPAGNVAQPGAYPAANRIPTTVPNAGPGYPVQPAQFQQPAGQPAATPAAPNVSVQALLQPANPGEHPLAPAVRWAKSAVKDMERIKDYSATLVKRERIDGALNDHEYMFVKVRNQPFSVYIYFKAPEKVKGQECLYVEGQNGGNLQAHANGLRHKMLGTLSLKPDGMVAMSGNRYPVTQLGIKKLSERLIEVGEHDMQFGECEVKVLQGAKINGRECTCVQVTHPTPRKEFIFHLARIFVDNELNVPIRYEAYEWPTEAGGQPLLAEEYTYLNLKLNNNYADIDFDVNNPDYRFK